jgi:hypothetical protein
VEPSVEPGVFESAIASGARRTATRGARGRRLLRALVVELVIILVVAGMPALLFAFPNNPTGLRLVLVGGPSMQPSLGTMNVLLLRRSGDFPRFAVTQTRWGGIHRIVALPGETFWVAAGHICVRSGIGQGSCLAEPYIGIPNPRWNRPPRTLGPDEYAWVADNRAMRFARVVTRSDLVAVLVTPIYSWGGRWH